MQLGCSDNREGGARMGRALEELRLVHEIKTSRSVTRIGGRLKEIFMRH